MRISLLEKINPTLKAIVLIICCIIMAAAGSWKVNAAVIIMTLLCMVFLSRCSLYSVVKLYIPLIFLGFLIFVSSFLSTGIESSGHAVTDMTSFDTALLLGTRILSYASIGILFGFTTDNKMFAMSMMQQLHIPPKFAYGVLAALHLVPTLRREWDEVMLAYAVRQKHTGLIPFGPLFNTLVNGIRWSESVAMAMESKGFDGDGKRTFYMKTFIQMKDIVFAIIGIGSMLLFWIMLK